MKRHRRACWERGWGLALAAAVAAFGLTPWTPEAGAGEGPVVANVEVRGVTPGTAGQVKQRMSTRQGQPLQREVLEDDFKRLWNMGIFSDIQILEEEARGGGLKIVVLLKEKQVIRRLAFRGNDEVRDSTLAQRIGSRVGKLYDPGMVARDQRGIEDYYRTQGFHFVTVNPVLEEFEDGVRLVFEIDEGEKVRVRRIIFHGNEHFTDRELEKLMQTKATTFFTSAPFDSHTFQLDLQKLRLYYQSRGFLDAKVEKGTFEVSEGPDKGPFNRRDLFIHVMIEEGQRYQLGSIEFEGNELYDVDTLRGLIGSMPGQYYDQEILVKDVRAIRDHYAATGRWFTRIRPEKVYAGDVPQVDLVFRVNEGEPVVIEDVAIVGLNNTKDYVVRREVEVYPGEVPSPEGVRETVRNLRRLNYFRPETMNVEVKPGSGEDRARLEIELEEVPTGRFMVGAGYSSSDGALGSFELSQRNFDYTGWPETLADLVSGRAFTGAGQKFNATVQAGGRLQNYKVDFLNPWIYGRPIRFGLGAFHNTREWDSYDETRSGAYVMLGRQLGNKYWDVSGTLKVSRIKLDNFNDDDDLPDDLLEEEGSVWIPRFIPKLSFDTRDNVFDTNSGWHAFLQPEVAFGDKEFWRVRTEVNRYWTLFSDRQERPVVLALSGAYGKADSYGDTDDVPIYDRLYAGGISTIRGFENRSVSPRQKGAYYGYHGEEVGGHEMAVGRAELYIPLIGKVARASAFYDYGSVRFDQDKLGDQYDPGMTDWDWRSSWGVGIHIKIPLGPMPVRIYYTRPIDEVSGDQTERVQFTMGAIF